MKKIASVSLVLAMMAFSLAGCGQKSDDLVTKKPFPEFSEKDMEGNIVTSDIFSDYDATIVNFWSNGCGSCVEEMPYLEELYQEFKDKNINLIGVGSDSGQGEEELATAKEILSAKGVTYCNISPDPDNELYKDFISELNGYPTTYVVDKEGNIIGAPIIGVVEGQEDTLNKRIESIEK